MKADSCKNCKFAKELKDMFGNPYYTCHHEPYNGIYSDTIECPLEKKSKKNRNK